MTQRRAAVALYLTMTLSVVLCGCGSDGDGSGVSVAARPEGIAGASPPVSASGSGAGAAGPPATAPLGDATGPITLAFAGDVHFEGRLAPLLAAGRRPVAALAGVATELAAADLSVVNLETAVTTRGVRQPKTYTFRTSPAAFDALAGMGVDVVTMANNHGVDFGATGLADTLAARARAPVAVVGIGTDEADAFAPAVRTVKGVRVAVIGASNLEDPTTAFFSAGPRKAGVANGVDPTRLAEAVRTARQVADVVVVYYHWGTENQGCPNTRQRAVTPELVAAGADVIVGAHAHRPVGSGWWTQPVEGRRPYVSYGLGNFVWYSSSSLATRTTGVLTLTLRGRKTVKANWAPMLIDAAGLPRAVTGQEGARFTADWQALRGCAGLLGAP